MRSKTDADSRFSAISRLLVWLLLVLCIGAAAISQWPSLKLSSDIFSLLPAADQRPVVQAAVARQKERLNNRVIFMASGVTAEDAVKHAKSIEKDLLASNLFTEVERAIKLGDQASVYQKLSPYRFLLMTPADQNALTHSPAEYIQQGLQVIYSPLGLERLATLQQDPLHTFGDYLASLSPDQLSLVDETPIVKDNATGDYFALITTDASGKATGMGYYRQLLGVYSNIKHTASQQKTTVLAAGLPLYTAFGAQSAESEVSTVGTISILAIVLLVFVTFRSARPLFLTLTSIGFGISCGFTASLVLFSEIHLLTLVFGSSLIGISVDYAFHYFCAFFEKQDRSALQRLAEIFPGITLGMATSVFAFSGLYFSPFPGLQQIAVFSAAGLLGAWATVVLLFPFCFHGCMFTHAMPLNGITHRLTVDWPAVFFRRPGVLVGAVAVFILIGSIQNRVDDDIRHFQDVPSELKQQEDRIKSLLGAQTDSRFFLVTGQTPDDVAENESHLRQLVKTQIHDKQLAGMHGLTDYYPTTHDQKSNYQLYQTLFDTAVISDFLTQLGMAETEQQGILTAFKKAQQQLNVDTFVAAMPEHIAGYWLGCNPECASMVTLSGISGQSAVDSLRSLADGNNILWVDQVADYSALLKHYRQQTGQFLVVIVLLILVILSLVVGIKSAIAILMTPVTAIMLTLAALGYGDAPITLFNVFALLLILGISLDYAIFYHLSSGHKHSTALAVLLSLITTLLAFGMLGVSDTSVISAFGITLTLGVISAAIIAPLTPSRSQ
ncbi:Uncharacterised protein [BD1-7 clade bacterium]|uniref:Membrane transport protein MMPL domain-containing protein n=1 Tax=BD1-7 clade bacterium TaxID=2029982 RepID=A0A5S9PVI5_9GAMM|nr:Uncharacterised protein [BD1-7 clade bacterium]